MVVAQCDALIEAIAQRKQELLKFVGAERDMKIKILKDQAVSCTSHLQRTTSLLYFCVEVLKETDPTSFLQVRFLHDLYKKKRTIEDLQLFPNDKILDLQKLKAFAVDKIDMTQKLKFVSGRVENMVKKGENVVDIRIMY